MIDWRLIVEKYSRTVWYTAYRLLGNEADASDCFQETFMSALEVSKQQKIRNFSALLLRIASDKAIDILRRKLRQQRSNIDLSTLANRNPGPAADAQCKELIDYLRDALIQLPANEAHVFCLRYLGNMSYRQIGKELDVKTNRVGIRLRRAKTKLRDILNKTYVQNEK